MTGCTGRRKQASTGHRAINYGGYFRAPHKFRRAPPSRSAVGAIRISVPNRLNYILILVPQITLLN